MNEISIIPLLEKNSAHCQNGGSILLSATILIMATNSQAEKFGQSFIFVVSSTSAIAVSSYEWNTANNDLL